MTDKDQIERDWLRYADKHGYDPEAGSLKRTFHDAYELGKLQASGGQVNEDNFAKSEPKPAEPTCTETLTDDSSSQSRNLSQDFANCDKGQFPGPVKMVDGIIKDGFKNHNRLHIAAMAMQGLLANPYWMQTKAEVALEQCGHDRHKAAGFLLKDIAGDAMEMTDALLAACKRGGGHE